MRVLHEVVVVGGGNAGMSIAGRLRRSGVSDVAVIEPRTEHLYQPLFSHIAGGTARSSQAKRPQTDALPRGVEWIRGEVTSVDAHEHVVTLAGGDVVAYRQLIVCPGIERRWDLTPGLADGIRTPRVTSHYEYDLAAKTSRLLKRLRRGTVVFTEPPGPASCAGASQKPMYLACDYWRAAGVLDDIRVVLVLPTPSMFPVPIVDAELRRKVEEYGIEVRYSSELAEVDAGAQVATVRSADGVAERIGYDVLNVVPPQRAPGWIAASGLSDEVSGGFVAIDPLTLRSSRYPDVWALGDAAATLNAKSGGALRKQTKVLAQNLTAVRACREPLAAYDGYTVAPFTVSRRTVVFAEFDDRDRPQPTIPSWPGLARERRLTWVFDRHILPWVYWHLILKGRA